MNQFISETEIERRKHKRQEEWEKVRKADDPIEAPEEEYDPRSLYERLQEQKDKKQRDFEESIKFKNQFRGIDKDEADFLGEIAARASNLEKQKKEEEEKELKEFRTAVRKNQLTGVKPVAIVAPTQASANHSETKSTKSQSMLIKQGVKRKSVALDSDDQSCATSARAAKKASESEDAAPAAQKSSAPPTRTIYPSAQQCVGFLPGIGSYDSDSDSSGSVSSTDIDVSTTLLGEIIYANARDD